MTTALWLFFAQGVLGAFDTLYYHEYRARLPGGVPGTSEELRLHAFRDFIYAVLFATLPFVEYRGAYAWLLAALLAAEIVITLRDFVVEGNVRKPLGGVYPGERVTHAIMGIIFGAALANLLPELWRAQSMQDALVSWDAPPFLRATMPLMAAGVFLSGLRDLAATYGVRLAQYPWKVPAAELALSEEPSPARKKQERARTLEAEGFARKLEEARRNPGPFRRR